MRISNARRQISMVMGIPSRTFTAQLRTRNARIFRRTYAQQTTTRISSGNRRWVGPALTLVGTFAAASAVYVWANGQGATTDEAAVQQPKIIAPVSEEQTRERLNAQHAQIEKMAASPGVYTWGSNSHRVADPDSSETIIKQPHRLRYFEGRFLKDIKLDQASGAAIIENGDLVQWGKGYSETDFQPVSTLTGKNLVSISLSRDRIIALSSSGNIYSIPISKEDQQSGSKPSESSWIPGWSSKSRISYRQLNPELRLGEKVTSITSGQEHVLLLTNTGRVFSAAAATDIYPSRGQLGVPGLTWATRPKGPVDFCHEISTLKGSKIKQIASGDFHSLLLDDKGRVFVFGDNSFGQLGVEYNPTLQLVDTPRELPMKRLYPGKVWSIEKIMSIASGGFTSFLIVDTFQKADSDDNLSAKQPSIHSFDTWAFGRGIHGALGTGRWTHIQDRPSKVKALSGLSEYDEKTQKVQPIRPVQLAVGATHAAAVLGNNAHLTASRKSTSDKTWGQDTLWWGGNESLQVGTGKRSNVSTPSHILPPPDLVTATSTDEARFQIIPGKQRIECGRQVTAIYSVKN